MKNKRKKNKFYNDAVLDDFRHFFYILLVKNLYQLVLHINYK